jgi:uncharacterized membrane protein YoaK (UPF0700 family)
LSDEEAGILHYIEKTKEYLSGDDKISHRIFIIFFLALLSNILGCIFSYFLIHKVYYLIWIVGFIIPMVNFSISLLFLEAKSLREKIYIMLANSIALSLSGVIVSLYF